MKYAVIVLCAWLVCCEALAQTSFRLVEDAGLLGTIATARRKPIDPGSDTDADITFLPFQMSTPANKSSHSAVEAVPGASGHYAYASAQVNATWSPLPAATNQINPWIKLEALNEVDLIIPGTPGKEAYGRGEEAGRLTRTMESVHAVGIPASVKFNFTGYHVLLNGGAPYYTDVMAAGWGDSYVIVYYVYLSNEWRYRQRVRTYELAFNPLSNLPPEVDYHLAFGQNCPPFERVVWAYCAPFDPMEMWVSITELTDPRTVQTYEHSVHRFLGPNGSQPLLRSWGLSTCTVKATPIFTVVPQ